MQFESLPEKRAVPAFVKKTPAQSVLLELMKSGEAERETSCQNLEREQKRADQLAVALALQVYRKRASDDVLVRALTALLADMQVQLLTYAGETLSPELENGADIIEWLPAEDNEAECVVEAIEPEIRWQGRILHRAKLSCRKSPEREPEMAPEMAVTGTQEAVAQTAQETPPQAAGDAGETVSSEPRLDQPIEMPDKPNLFSRIKAIWNRLTARRNEPEAPAKAEEIATDQKDLDIATDKTDQESATDKTDQESDQEGSKTI